MNNTKALVALTNDYYNQTALKFDATRQRWWQGWNLVYDYINKCTDDPVKLVDLACGNGRFLKFLLMQNVRVSYLGIDNNKVLLSKAKQLRENSNIVDFDVLEEDLITNMKSIKLAFTPTVLTVFGFTHHIPEETLRQEWFKNLGKIFKYPKIIVLSFWLKNDVENEILTQKDSNISRYVHNYSDTELANITEEFVKQGYKLRENYIMDQNRYLIFKKEI